MWDAITGLVAEIRKCESAGAMQAGIALAYISIDTMAFLAMPEGRQEQTREDFMGWVDAYLKGDPQQPYQYRGLDVYGARCAFLHSYGAMSGFHQKNPEARFFGYHDGGTHMFDPQESERLVLIGTASFLNDVVIAIESFLKACRAEGALRARVETRLPKVLRVLPAPNAA